MRSLVAGKRSCPVELGHHSSGIVDREECSIGHARDDLVRVTGPVAVASTSAPEYSAKCTDKSTPPQMGTTFNGFEATAGGQTLAIGLGFYNTVTYCLPCAGVAMPYPCVKPVTNQSFASVSGVVEPEYSASGMVYLQISPVSDADLP